MASKSKRNRTKFKWTKELIFLMAGIVVLIVAAILINIPTKASVQLDKYNNAITAYNTKNSTQYSTIPENHVYKEVSIKSLQKKKKSDNYTFVFYCSLTNETTLEYLSKINSVATEYEIKTVYLWFADYVENSDADTKKTVKYHDKVSEYNNIVNANINSKVEGSNIYYKQDNFDLEIYPALLVFKSDSLIYNSQTYSENDDSSQLNWDIYVSTALKYSHEDELTK